MQLSLLKIQRQCNITYGIVQRALPHLFDVKQVYTETPECQITLINKEIEEMKLGIVAQQPIFITPYKSINMR